jgi:hypothetical protein
MVRLAGKGGAVAMIGRLAAVAAALMLLAGCGVDSMLQRKLNLLDATPPSTVERADALLQADRPAQSIPLYEQVIAAGGPERGQALYGLALARLHAGSELGDEQKARTALETLVREYPEHEHRLEASVLIELIDATARERERVAAREKALSGTERELEKVRAELGKKEEALENLRKALMDR